VQYARQQRELSDSSVTKAKRRQKKHHYGGEADMIKTGR
jgi:hypothetical protein